ncbi:MAG: MFS transporter [Usitatibacter sp.]
MIGLVGALGIAQIISWGSLYYAIGVLGPEMRADLGVSELFLFASFTVGLLAAGVLAPAAGRLIDRKGGRTVLSSGSILGAVSMIVLALATNEVVLILGWVIAGAAMSATLYDPAFATLSQHAGDRYRRAVTALTLLGGFASTVFWPLSHLLLEAWGWRATLGIYAGMHLLICLPLHALVIPPAMQSSRGQGHATDPAARSPAFESPSLFWLNAAFATANLVVGVIAVHMVGLLSGAGLTAAQAVTVSMLMGPMQVAGRVIEITFLARVRATLVGAGAFLLIVLALVLLAAGSGNGALAIAFVVAYGCGNGILTIVRGAAPAELYGSRGLGELLGYLARASSYARALAPAGYSLMLTIGFTQSTAMGALAAMLIAGLACYAIATRGSSRTIESKHS